jgi:hypothetical protein
MNTLKHVAALALLALAQAGAHAGSPGGLQLVVLGSDKAAAHSAQVKAFFASYRPGEIACLDTQLNIGSGYSEASPKGFTPALALAAVKDKNKRKELARLMSAYRDKQHKRGFDGALAYDIKDGMLELYGISAFADAAVEVARIAPADASDAGKFTMAVCRALVNLPVMEAP